ncbi:MAG: hypothetical protein Kow0069_29100 [Promethearchaeota archaeon]
MSDAGILLGVDAGSTSVKVVALDASAGGGEEVGEGAVVKFCSAPVRGLAEPTVWRLLKETGAALKRAGLKAKVGSLPVAVTGRNGHDLKGLPPPLPEAACLAAAAHSLHPDARTVVDLGGFTNKVAKLDAGGRLVDLASNDVCSSGGRIFLELVAKALGLSVERLDELAMQAPSAAPVTSQCSIFAESEVIYLVNEGVDVSAVAASVVKGGVATGYGREKVPFVQKSLSEISCHGRGAHELDPSVRTVVGVGGQDCKVVKLDGDGDLVDFVMNEKCAAGTGRYLELMSQLLGVDLPDLGALTFKAKRPVTITSSCSIYAQAEVLRHLAQKAKIADVAAGVNRAMAERVQKMAARLTLDPQFVVTGGVAKNAGVVWELERLMKVKFNSLPFDPQLVGALGAAHFALDLL